MNQLNVNQTGGFPMTTRILDELQKAFRVFNTFGAIVGDKSIISGCVTTGSNVSDGVVYVNNETFDFVGGSAQTKVKIVEAPETLVFEDNTAKTVIRKRYVTFGTGVGAMDWVDFKRGFETKGIETALNAINTSLTAIGTKLDTIEAGAQVQLQSDWDQTDNTKKDYVKNKDLFLKVLRSGTFNIGNPGGSTNHQINFAALPNNNYQVLITLVSTGNHGINAGTLQYIVNDKQSNYFKFYIQEGGNYTQDVKLDWTLISL